MKHRRTFPPTLLLLAALAGGALDAADKGYSFDFKLRGGLKGGDARKDHHDNKAFGLGLGVSRPMGKGLLTGELSFDVLPGQARETMPMGQPVYAPSGTGFGTASPAGSPYFLRVNDSADLRKESSQGFSLKCGYSAPLGWWEGLSWQAGGSLDAYKTASEFTGTVRPFVLVGTTPTSVKDSQGRQYYEGWALVKHGKAIAPGFYAGFRQVLSEDIGLELNLRNIGLKHYDYRPMTYTGTAAVMESSTRRAFVVDVALAMKF